MPRVIELAPEEEAISLEELVAILDASGFDPRDEDSLCEMAPYLRKLGNNRTFLADLAIRELKNGLAFQARQNSYGAQVILLHRADNYFLRANIWPARDDALFRSSGVAPFFYYVPHDHNFNFLTIGYYGPGYWSDYYEYDCDRIVGLPDEKVDLRFVEHSRLEQGKIMLYRAHRDVHSQLPADSLSISLNIMEAGERPSFSEQYRFDIGSSSIAEILTHSSLDSLIGLAAHLGGERGEEILRQFSEKHPNHNMRLQAIKARAGAAPTIERALEIAGEGMGSASSFVRGGSERHLARIQESRGWLAKT